MKKLFFISALFLAFLVTSCSNNSPKVVAEKFLTEMENQNFEEAKKYADDSMQQLLTMLNGMPKDNNKKAENVKVKVVRVEENGDKAKAFYIVEGKEVEGESKEQSIDLKKVDGKWKVSFNKEDANKEGMNNSESTPETDENPSLIEEDTLNIETDTLSATTEQSAQ